MQEKRRWRQILIAKIDDIAIKAILAIVNKGNKAIVQRCKDGIIVMEEKRTIKYRNATPIRE